MDKISKYCMDFAERHSLKAIKDDANNVVIYKNATKGYENSKPVVLQGHLDMVCQKEPNCNIDFEKAHTVDVHFPDGSVETVTLAPQELRNIKK